MGEIASRIDGTVRGDPSQRVTGIRPLDQAGPEDLSFVAHPRYRSAARVSRAAGLIVAEEGIAPGRNLILVKNPYAALAAAMGLFYSEARSAPGISPQAVLGEGTRLGRDVSIGPFVVLGRGCLVGDRVALLPGVVLGDEVRVGEDSVLHPGVVVYSRSVLGARVIVHASSVVGSDGFGYAEAGGARAKIDNLVQIAHNVTIGEDSILVAQSGIAGSTRLGRGVILAGQSGAAGHLSIGDRSVVGAKSAVLQDVPPGAFVVGHPAADHRRWKRSQAALGRLPDLLRVIARLERARERGDDAPANAKRPRVTARTSGSGRRTPRGRAARS